jgi:hypothetical protein
LLLFTNKNATSSSRQGREGGSVGLYRIWTLVLADIQKDCRLNYAVDEEYKTLCGGSTMDLLVAEFREVCRLNYAAVIDEECKTLARGR